MVIWRRYSFGLVLLTLFVIALGLMTWSDWMYFVSQQAEHHQTADVFSSSGYIWRWGLDVFSNWQADFLGETLAIVFGVYLIFRGSEESRDSSEEVQQIAHAVEREVRGQEPARQAQRTTEREISRGGPLRNYGLGIVMFGAFLVSWALMTWTGWMHFASTAQEHGESAQLFGSSGYIWEWIRETTENWQADALGRGLLIVLPAYLLFKNSPQSREGMDRVKAMMARVQKTLQNRQQPLTAGDVYVENRPIPPEPKSEPIWKKYSLAIPFLVAFVGSWIVQTLSGWQYFVGEQTQHHSVADVFGASGYIWQWGVDTFSNWQSDLLWGGLIVLMGAYFVFRGSAESNDSDERIEQLAGSIEKQVRGQDAAERAQRETNAHVLGDLWHQRGLAYSLIAAGIAAWALMTWMGWMNYSSSQQEHRSTAELFGASGYIWDWARLTFENWQSDILGNAATVILSAYLLFKGSGVSREDDDELEQTLQRIDQALRSDQAAIQPQPARSGDVQSARNRPSTKRS